MLEYILFYILTTDKFCFMEGTQLLFQLLV